MTTNIDRAAENLYEHRIRTADFPDGPTEWCDLPESWREEWREAAQALADAGLLMPDLPEPEGKGYSGHPTWFEDTVEPRGGEVEIYHGGYANGENEDLYTPANAREFALGILAAADHAERNQK